MTILQNFILPAGETLSVSDMYIRPSPQQDNPTIDGDALHLRKGAQCSFDTYFNVFAVAAWQQKCALDDLSVSVSGSGELSVEIIHQVDPDTMHVLTAAKISLDHSQALIPIEDWKSITRGIIYVKIQALDDCLITAASFQTSSRPSCDVKLGIVVTHFKRKAYVVPAIKRVSDTLLSTSDLRDNIDLIVVDNSQDITPDESGLAIIIPNANLGGSGGFTRGLLHLKDNGYSHCLFMDDDASCEMESIYRTYRLLQFARNERLAVAGAMIMEHNLYETHEIGAAFRKGKAYPLAKGLDLRSVTDVLTSVEQESAIDYGAWWHFAFKIDALTCLPFPFFVRGDDQLFSIANDFDITTLNGVAVWAEDFATKDTPSAKYLTQRSSLLLFSWQNLDRYRAVRHFYKTIRHCLFSLDYPGAQANILAAHHFLMGPKFWVDNIAMSKVFPHLAKISAPTQLKPISNERLALAEPMQRSAPEGGLAEPVCRKILRKLTMNGHLLPRFLNSRRPILSEQCYSCDPRQAFLKGEIIQLIKEPNLGFTLQQSKARFFKLYFATVWTALRLFFQMPKTREIYLREMPQIMSETFWRSVYDKTEFDVKT